MRIIFDKPGSEPNYLAGAHYIEEMIKSGQLKYGESLPSIREFAEDNGLAPQPPKEFTHLSSRKVLSTPFKAAVHKYLTAQSQTITKM